MIILCVMFYSKYSNDEKERICSELVAKMQAAFEADCASIKVRVCARIADFLRDH